MTNTQFRSWVHGLVEAWRVGYAGMDVLYENGEMPEETSISSPWIDVSLRFSGADDITVGTRPRGRTNGTVCVMVFHKVGEGTGVQDGLVDSLTEMFRANRGAASARLAMPQPATPTEFRGWRKTGVLVPFNFDTA